MAYEQMVLVGLLLLLGPAAPQDRGGPPFEIGVRQDRFVGGPRGALVFGQDEVEFRAQEQKESRRWDYLGLKQVRILSPTRIALDTYEDQGLLRLGRDRSFSFETTSAIPGELAAFLLARIDRPVVTAVMPPLPPAELFRAPVKHARAGRGSEGTLRLYDTAMAYVTEREGEARFWRFRDVFGVLMLDRYRLQVLAYEGASGETRPFTFELEEPLPPGMYDALWQRVNAPVRPTTSANSQREERNYK